jgi:hypothetical protein
MRGLGLVGLVACADKVDDSGESVEATCESGDGLLTGQVWNANVEGDPVPMEGAAVYLFSGGTAGGTPDLELRSEADGRFSVPVEPGRWTLTGEELGTGCFTGEAVSVSVSACAEEEVKLTMDVWRG